jgi:hypothetical protein
VGRRAFAVNAHPAFVVAVYVEADRGNSRNNRRQSVTSRTLSALKQARSRASDFADFGYIQLSSRPTEDI